MSKTTTCTCTNTTNNKGYVRKLFSKYGLKSGHIELMLCIIVVITS